MESTNRILIIRKEPHQQFQYLIMQASKQFLPILTLQHTHAINCFKNDNFEEFETGGFNLVELFKVKRNVRGQNDAFNLN